MTRRQIPKHLAEHLLSVSASPETAGKMEGGLHFSDSQTHSHLCPGRMSEGSAQFLEKNVKQGLIINISNVTNEIFF